MVVAAIILLFFALIGWLGLRFGLNAAENSLGRAKVVLLSAVCSFVVLILTLVFFDMGNVQNDMATLIPVRSLEDYALVEDDRFVMIEGRIDEDMSTKRESYVAYLRLERSLTDNSTGDAYSENPSWFDIDLTNGGAFDVGAGFTELERFLYDYSNWSREEENFYIYYFVERGDPVVVVGRPSSTSAEPSLYDTRLMYVGTAEDYIANVSPSLMRWAYFGWAMSVVGLVSLLVLVSLAYPVWAEIRKDDSFHWSQLWAEARVG